MQTMIRPRVLDTRSGETFQIDPEEARIERLQRRICTWADVLRTIVASLFDTRLVMMTLTYAPTPDGTSAWRPNHIRDFMKRVRYNLADNLLAYAWVAEMQQRGEVHYHVLLLVKKGTSIPRPDQSWWSHGMSKIETARSPYYVVKYCSKKRFKVGDEWKAFPKGMRIFSVWISKEVITDEEHFRFRLSALPKWLRDTLTDNGVVVTVRRAQGGGWTITGDAVERHIPSPYRVLSIYELLDEHGQPTGVTY